ncbi:MAG: hypothetical protein JNM70_27255, partial [Anaerolineae bacterium]|nr:hypothetical protein [Anaerolineae bacterium]
MAKDVAAQRRRAALAALAGVLDEAALLQELWLLGEALRGESVTDIIEYVDGLARRQMLDAATCKRLYGEFFKALRLPEQNLPADPWPAMQAARPAPAPARVMAAPLAQPPAQPSWVPPRAAPVGSAWAAAAAVDIVVPPAAPAPAA